MPIPPGGAMFELTIPNPGAYPFVTHSFAGASMVGHPRTAAADVSDSSWRVGEHGRGPLRCEW